MKKFKGFFLLLLTTLLTLVMTSISHGPICASLSPDGKHLFYAANRDIYWVSTEVIERFRPE